MKISSPTRFTGFYESFSDLIFGVMAIFVLLLIVFLSIVRPEGNKAQVDSANEYIESLEIRLKQAETQRDAARAQLDELAKSAMKAQNTFTSKGLELIIAIDVSGSMDDAMGHLVETIRTIASVLPAVSPSFRLGIIAYAEDRAGLIPNGLQILELKQIFPQHKDGGRSVNAVNQFLENVTRGIAAPVDKAILQTLKMSSSPDKFDGHQALLIIGDVGPYEMDDGYKIEPKERVIEAEIVSAVGEWASQRRNRSVISVYSAATPDKNASEKTKSSYEFFRSLAVEAGQPKNFSQNSGNMLGYLLSSIIDRDE